MHKVSRPYQINTYKGWLIRWYESGIQKYKTFPTKESANLFRADKIRELNPDIYGLKERLKEKTYDDAVKEYLNQRYDLKAMSPNSKREPVRVLEYFKDTIKPKTVTRINQDAVNRFVAARLRDGVSKWTVNKDIGVFRAFLNWLIFKEYHRGHIELSKVKAPPIVKKSLTDDEIRKLLKACPDKAWQMRILFGLVTGLRVKDTDNLLTSQINLKSALIDFTVARKTGKVCYDRPLPSALIPALKRYIKTLDKNDDRLFQSHLYKHGNLRHQIWESIRDKAGLPDVTRQDFRVTHSTRLQKIGSIATAQHSLQHFSAKTTGEYYTDWQVIMRWKVEQLPIAKWIKGIF